MLIWILKKQQWQLPPIYKTENNKSWKGCEKLESLCSALLVRIENGIAFVWYDSSSKKLKTKLPHDLEIPLLHPKELKVLIQTVISTPMFLQELFTKVREWKLPMCSLIGEWIDKM